MSEQTQPTRSFRWRRPLLRLLLYARRGWRRIENLVFGVVLTLITLYFVLQLSVVQNWIIGKITGYLSTELNTEVRIRRVDISLFDNLVLEGFYVADQQGDTLLYADKLVAGLNSNIFTLFRDKLEFNEISLEKARFNIRRGEDQSDTNLQFILDYFDSGPSRQPRKKTPFRIRVQTLRLVDVAFLQDDQKRGQRLAFHIPTAGLRINNLDIPSKVADIQTANFDGLVVRIEDFPRPANRAKKTSLPAPDSLKTVRQPFQVKIGRFQLQNGKFQLDKWDASGQASETPATVMDYDHLNVQDIDFQAENVAFDDDLNFAGQLTHLAAREKCGFQLAHGSARQVVVRDTIAALYGLQLQTPGSTLGDTVVFRYAEYNDFNDFTDRVNMEGRFAEGSVLQLSDVMFFSPNLLENSFFLRNRGLRAQIAGTVEGRVNRLKGRNLHIQLGENTFLRGSFDGQNLAEGQDKLVLEFDFEPLQSNMQTISSIIPGFSAPQQFKKLGNIRFDGTYQIIFGYNHIVNGQLFSDIGSGDLDMELDLTRGREKARYSGLLNLKDFNLAAWTGNRNFGSTTFHVRISEGSGLTLPTIKATVSGTVDTFYFRGYNYRKIEMNGTFAENVFNGQLGIEDPNVDFDFDGSVNFKDSIPVYMFSAKLNRLDMGVLNLVERDWLLSGEVERIRMRARTLDDLAGQVSLRNLRLIEDRTTIYKLDSVSLASLFRPNGNRYMLLRSDAVDAYIEGRFDFATAPGNLLTLFSKYYPPLAKQLGLPEADSTFAADDKYGLTVRIKDTRNLTQLFAPDLDTLRGIALDGEVNAAEGQMKITLRAPWLRYDGTQADDLFFKWESRGSEADYELLAPRILLSNRQTLDTIRLNGSVRPNALRFALQSRNAPALVNHVNLNGVLSATPDSLWQVQFDPSDIALFNEQWAIEENNYVRFGRGSINTQNFQLFSVDDRRIALNSLNEGRGLAFILTNFDLKNLNDFFTLGDVSYRGKLYDFEVNVGDIFNMQGVEVFLTSDTLFLNEQPYGEITGNFEMADLKSPMAGKIFLQSMKHRLRIAGAWLPENGQARELEELGVIKPGEVQMNVTATNFPASVAGLFIPSISKVAGAFDAQVRFGGALKRIGMQGSARIRDAQFQIDYLKTMYHIHGQDIKLSNTQIWADDTLTIWDGTDRNKAYLVGGLRHNYFRDWQIDCDMETVGNNFTVLNTYREDNELYYGQGIGYFRARFSGTFSRTNIYIDAVTGSQTRLYIPISGSGDAQDELFIKFKNKNEVDTLRKTDGNSIQINDLKGLNFEMNITVTDAAEVQLIFDEQAGDIIKGRGEGDITLTINREGEFKMYGGYTIRRGEYLFTLLNLVNKPFNVSNGGTISWSGNPYGAIINLDATYEENTSVYNFINTELALIAGDQTLVREATQATRVVVTMHLKGSLLTPTISFDMDFPNLTGQIKTLVDNKLRQAQQDQNELNRQVFGLVVVGSFLPSNSGNTETLIQASAFNTLTQVLSNQFSNYLTGLAAEWFGTKVSSIDLDVAYNEYQNSLNDPNLSQIGRELQVRLTSGFAQDRITLQFGSQFGLGRPGTAVQDGFLGEDVTVEIQLTENRQWRLKVYQRTEPDIAIGQRRSRYGFGISFRKDYDSFDDMMSGLTGWFRKNN